MTEPRRLRDLEGTSSLQHSLLGAMADEAPRPDAKERTLAALGVSAGAVGGAAAATAAIAKGGTSLVWVKWLGALLAVGIVGGATYYVGTRGSVEPVASSSARTVQVQSAPKVAQREEPAASTSSVPTLAAEQLPTVVAPAATAVTAPRGSAEHMPRATSADGTLAEELALMDAARTALAAGEPARSITAVDAYEARFPHGAFVQEAEFVRVRALFEAKDPGGRRAAQAFLTQYPTSPYASKVRTLAGSAP
jgi:hypothetical protein